jgi:hypothetical protein
MKGPRKTAKRTGASKRTDTYFVLGRAGFAKISAVEGLKITAAMEAEFQEFDRKGLSPSERRAAISRKYGRAR